LNNSINFVDASNSRAGVVSGGPIARKTGYWRSKPTSGKGVLYSFVDFLIIYSCNDDIKALGVSNELATGIAA
jgi:hypothetical protein